MHWFKPGHALKNLPSLFAIVGSFIQRLLTKTNCVNCNQKTLSQNYLCPDCYLTLNLAPGFKYIKSHKVYYICYYEDLIRDLLISYKYNNNINLALILANLAVQTITYFNLSYQYLAFVPSNKIRYLKRGFNHNLEICKLIAKKQNLILLPDYFIKIRYTKPQSSLSKSKRSLNLNKAFIINKKYHKSCYTNILIFDDIMTTSSTIKTIDKLISKAQIKYNYLCLANTKSKL